MERQVRARYWVECAAGAASGLLAVLTVVWRDWIELVTGLDPDHHSGALEWLLVAVFCGVAVSALAGARLEWQRRDAVLS